MIPVPQYPLYKSLIIFHKGIAVPYFLDENDEWTLDVTFPYNNRWKTLQRIITEPKS